MMSSLHELQRVFAASMFREPNVALCAAIDGQGFSVAERLRIYRNTFYSTLTQAIRIAYPALDRLVGRQFFDAAAEQFVRACPPSSAYLNEYGEGFAEFIEGLETTRDFPYLPDVARFEWALSRAANAPDVPALTAHALATVDTARHAALRFEPHPSVRLLRLDYPADLIADAVMAADDAAMAQIDVAPTEVRLVVYRGPDGVAAQRLGPDEYRFLSRLHRGEPLERIMTGVPSDAPRIIASELTHGRLQAFNLLESGR